jgi:hypothetical protein
MTGQEAFHEFYLPFIIVVAAAIIVGKIGSGIDELKTALNEIRDELKKDRERREREAEERWRRSEEYQRLEEEHKLEDFTSAAHQVGYVFRLTTGEAVLATTHRNLEDSWFAYADGSGRTDNYETEIEALQALSETERVKINWEDFHCPLKPDPPCARCGRGSDLQTPGLVTDQRQQRPWWQLWWQWWTTGQD